MLPDIERAAGQVFRDIGMAAIADDDPLPVDVLTSYQDAGRVLVAAEGRVPVAYLLLDVVDGNAHIEQVSVHPDHARRGLGSALIDAAEDWARRRSLPALTLTTFADVLWNAPYYRRLGFETIPEASWGPGLLVVRRHEAEAGLDAWARVAMRRVLAPARGRTARPWLSSECVSGFVAVVMTDTQPRSGEPETSN